MKQRNLECLTFVIVLFLVACGGAKDNPTKGEQPNRPTDAGVGAETGPGFDAALDARPTARGVLKIAVLSVEKADSALIVFPTGKTLMVDAASSAECKARVIPFLERHGINHLDYFYLTHTDSDHQNGIAQLKELGFIDSATVQKDFDDFSYEESFELEHASFFIYNARDTKYHGEGDNANSLSFRLEHEGFVYSTTGDEGEKSQNRFLRDHPQLVPAHVRNTAHHMRTPASQRFLIATNPYLFIISDNDRARTRQTFKDYFLPVVEQLKRDKDGRLREFLITGEVGHILIRATNGEEWHYETCKNTETCVFDEFP